MINVTCTKCGNNDVISEMQVLMSNGRPDYICSKCGTAHEICFYPKKVGEGESKEVEIEFPYNLELKNPDITAEEIYRRINIVRDAKIIDNKNAL